MSRYTLSGLLAAPLLLLSGLCFAGLRPTTFATRPRTWQAMRKHMLVIADSITDALAKQFPD